MSEQRGQQVGLSPQGQPVEQFKVASETNPNTLYVVSNYGNGAWACGCMGWTRHFPRRDCKHIAWVKMFGPMPIDPVLMAMQKAQRKVARGRS